MSEFGEVVCGFAFCKDGFKYFRLLTWSLKGVKTLVNLDNFDISQLFAVSASYPGNHFVRTDESVTIYLSTKGNIAPRKQ